MHGANFMNEKQKIKLLTALVRKSWKSQSIEKRNVDTYLSSRNPIPMNSGEVHGALRVEANGTTIGTLEVKNKDGVTEDRLRAPLLSKETGLYSGIIG